MSNEPQTRSGEALRRAWREFYREWRAWRRHRRGFREATGLPLDGKRLNVGCGKHRLEGWVNTDLFTPADLTFDVRERWPIADASLSLVRLEHVLEHVGYPLQARHVLRECFRVLRPGGTVRVGVPDTELVLRAYVSGPASEYFRRAREGWHPPEVRMPIEHVNFHFRDRFDEHKFAYDAEALRALLKDAGFTGVGPAPFDLQIDRPDREDGTLRLGGVRPLQEESIS